MNAINVNEPWQAIYRRALLRARMDPVRWIEHLQRGLREVQVQRGLRVACGLERA